MTTAAVITHDWPGLVDRIRRGDISGAEDLYRALGGGAHARLARTVGSQWVEDKFHDVVVTVLSVIQGGLLREPERLMGFVRTITQRRVALHVRNQIIGRRMVPLESAGRANSCELDPERLLAGHEQSLGLRRILNSLNTHYSEILVRFYLQEQNKPQICSEMCLTATQFRLHKSRALARCLLLIQRSTRPQPPSRRTSSMLSMEPKANSRHVS